MKKLQLSLIAAAALAMTACSSDEPAVNGGNGYQDGYVTFSVEMPGDFTRDIADGLKAEKLSYAVFNENGDFLFKEESAATFQNRETTVKIPLVNGKSYTVAFLASNPDNSPYSIADGGVLKVDYSKMNAANKQMNAANDDNYDLFYATDVVAVSKGMKQKEVYLYRTVAQVNVGATDWAKAKRADFKVEETTLTFTGKAYTEMTLLDGKVVKASETAVEFALAGLPDFDSANDKPATLTVGADEYEHVAMAYVLVPEDQDLVETVTFKFTGPNGLESVGVNAVPVRRNFRTNIVGQFFTTDVDYKIVVDQKFLGDLKPIEPDVVISAGANAQTDFEAALKRVANADDPIIIGLPANTEFTMPSTVKGKVTLLGNGPSTVVNMSGQISIANDISFEDIKMIRAQVNYVGFQHTGGEHYKNCTMEGTLWTYAYDVTFENCIFDPKKDDSYAVWCYGAPDAASGNSAKVSFTNCKFTGDNKAILIYNEHASRFDVTVDKCTFTATQDQSNKDNKCAIQMHTELGTQGTLTINNSTATGFADYNGGLWREVANNPKPAKVSDKFLITVDGKVIAAADKQ